MTEIVGDTAKAAAKVAAERVMCEVWFGKTPGFSFVGIEPHDKSLPVTAVFRTWELPPGLYDEMLKKVRCGQSALVKIDRAELVKAIAIGVPFQDLIDEYNERWGKKTSGVSSLLSAGGGGTRGEPAPATDFDGESQTDMEDYHEQTGHPWPVGA
jgi:hypothetical protein